MLRNHGCALFQNGCTFKSNVCEAIIVKSRSENTGSLTCHLTNKVSVACQPVAGCCEVLLLRAGGQGNHAWLTQRSSRHGGQDHTAGPPRCRGPGPILSQPAGQGGGASPVGRAVRTEVGRAGPQARVELTSGDTLGSNGLDLGLPDRRRQNKASVSPGHSGSLTADRAQGQDAGPGRKRPDTPHPQRKPEARRHMQDLDERARRDEAFPLASSCRARRSAGESRVWGS